MTRAFPSRHTVRGGAIVSRPRPGGHYGLLLITLIGSYLLSAFSFRSLAEPAQVVLFAVVFTLALRTSPRERRWARLAGVVVVAGSMAAVLAALGRTGIGTVSSALLCFTRRAQQ